MLSGAVKIKHIHIIVVIKNNVHTVLNQGVCLWEYFSHDNILLVMEVFPHTASISMKFLMPFVAHTYLDAYF